MTRPAGRAQGLRLRGAILGGLCLLATQLACAPEEGSAPAPARRERPSAGAARRVAPVDLEHERLLDECIERSLHGRGCDGLAARDSRRKLRRLQARAGCEAQLQP